MASLALYLKWRPQRFEDVVGQEHVTTTLKNALRSGRISHAYLFSGPRGTGKTTMARLLVKAVNCLDEDLENRPCNKCHICQSVNEGRLMDLIEMDAASHTGVDNVREAIRDKVNFRPTEARYKVYVIDEVHMLSTSAFNALLKTLEEPPEHVIFCLATTEPHRILPTIISRCQHFEFHRIPLSALVKRLAHISEGEGLEVEQQALQFIARMSSGCARDAISLLDQLTAYGDETITLDRVRSVLGLGDEQMVYDLLGHLAAHDVGAGLDVLTQVVDQGADVRQFTQQIVEYLRTTMLLRVGGQASLPDLDVPTREHLGTLVDRFTTHGLVRAIKLFNQARLDLRANDRNQLALELAFVEAAMPEEQAPPVVPAVAPAPQTVTAPASTPSQKPRPTPSKLRARPPTPPRRATVPETKETTGDQGGAEAPATAVVVSIEEVTEHWAEIRHTIRAASRQVEALVNSSTVRGIEEGNRLVLEFASEFLSSKLLKEENRQIVERVLTQVLGKKTRVRAVVKGTELTLAPPAAPQGESAIPESDEPVAPENEAPPAESAPVAPVPEPEAPVERVVAETDETSSASSETDSYTVTADPVVQDLVDLGGEVTDVQYISKEED